VVVVSMTEKKCIGLGGYWTGACAACMGATVLRLILA
jgi:hypothetical protein